MTGSGTQSDPYIIYDVNDLQAMNDDLTAYYELGGDIDASATSGWNEGAGFLPIGDGADFTGHFDGKDFAIDQLFINRPTTSRVGLFGDARPADIKNVELTLCDITGNYYVGALVGRVYGYAGGIVTIENCSSGGSVSGSNFVGGLFGRIAEYDYIVRVKDCHSSCTVLSTASYAGGLIGSLVVSEVIDSYATGDVTISTGDVWCYGGGFVGTVSAGEIRRCYATGNVSATSINTGVTQTEVGGFAGNAGGSVTSALFYDCYARGNVSAFATNDLEYVGGFIGRPYGEEPGSSEDGLCDNCYSTGVLTGAIKGGFCAEKTGFTITNCFWDTETSGVGTSDGGTGKTTAQMKTKSTFTDAGWDFTIIWDISPPINNGYPAFLTVVLPTVTTELATGRGTIAATINGTLNQDGGEACECGFEWGLDTNYGTTTPPQSKTTGETFSQVIGGLFPGTTYHFRAFATNSVGTSHGDDRTFATALVISRAFALAREEL